MNEKFSTRISHQPNWMISGLLKAAAFPEQEQNQPMFQTGVTYAELKTQVKALLARSGVDLTPKEISSGSHWLTRRIANDLTETDTKETLLHKINDFTMQYIVDKANQRSTGVSQRSPIRDRAWWDKHYNPPTDRNAASEEPSKDAPENGAEVIDMVYVGLDGDDMGHLVEDSLLSDDPEIAAKISNSIHDAHKAIRKLVAEVGGRMIFDGGDNMLLYMPNDPETLDGISEIHKRITKHSVTIGVGHRPIEAHYALVVGKNTGKDKIVAYDEKVKAQHETIHHEQKQLEDTQKKLKYRASALDDMGQANVADRLRRALSAQGQDASDKSIKELFWRLIQDFALDDMRAIDLFFAAADDADLVSAARQTYAKRMDWSLRCSEARELTEVEGRALLRSLLLAMDAARAADVKFQDLLSAVDDQALRDLDEAGTVVGKRFNKIANEFAEMFDDGDTKLRYSHYADEVHKITSEIASMGLPMDQALSTALKAVGNAEDAMNRSIDVGPVIEIVTKWIERVSAVTMALDMVCVVSGARPMQMKAADPSSQPVHFPGQSVIPGGTGQKSPHRRHDWLTIEDYNKDQVDWSKTDANYVSTNVPRDPEIPVGGAGGGDPIYVP